MTGRHDDQSATHYRTAIVDGVGVFYREAGPPDAPVVVLLHGFPSSSRMFRDLIPRLSDAYHVIAPDYPGFGHSAVPDRADFAYTFDHLFRRAWPPGDYRTWRGAGPVAEAGHAGHF